MEITAENIENNYIFQLEFIFNEHLKKELNVNFDQFFSKCKIKKIQEFENGIFRFVYFKFKEKNFILKEIINFDGIILKFITFY